MDRERQPAIGVALRDPWPWSVFAGLARDAESLGYDAVFLPEIAGRDAFAALTGLASETATIRLGSGIVPLPSRSIALTAMAAATVHERSGGRAILGIGTGPARPGALDALRDAVAELRERLGAGRSDPAGEATLDLPSPVPVWIAALGPRAMRLAGAVADGVILNWCPPERVRAAREELARGAEAAGRDPSAIEVAVYVRACLIEDGDAAVAAVRRATGEYASYRAYARQLEAVGLGDLAERAAAAHRAGRDDAVPDGLIHAVALVGDRAEARTRLDAYREAGADLPIVYPVAAGADPAESVAVTVEALRPGLHAPV